MALLRFNSLNLFRINFWSFLAGIAASSAFGAPGDLDPSFDPGPNHDVFAIVQQPDGKILIGGDFTLLRGPARNRIARLNADGTVDITFDPGKGASDSVRSCALQSDGKIVVGGGFEITQGTNSRIAIARLNNDGSLDTSFDSGSGPNLAVRCVALQSDGRVLLSGHFSDVNGVAAHRTARLNSDGSIDASFASPVLSGSDPWVYSLALQEADGKIIIGGAFSKVNSVSRNNIGRLNANGTLDGSFNPGSGADGAVRKVALQTDGKVIAVGWFTNINGVNRNYVARLEPDGELDTSFNSGSGPNDQMECVAIQPDGKVLIGGKFTAVDGIPRNHVARLNADGSLDLTFDPGAGANGNVYAIAVQANNDIVIGGGFTTFNNVSQNNAAHLFGGSDTNSLNPTITYDVTAQIDVADLLIIHGSQIQWHHPGGGSVVGLHGANEPTQISSWLQGDTNINNISWIPEWPNGSTAGNEAFSSPFARLSPALPSASVQVSAKVLDGRGNVTVTQTPSETNDWTLIVQFTDGFSGAAFLNARITVQSIPLRLFQSARTEYEARWTTNVPGLFLESTPNLPALPTDWTPATNPPILLQREFATPLHPSETQRFFRLRKS
jgi:uncharacterized delta-60 repeat protein